MTLSDKRPTIDQVAQLAKVSTATVSRVLNHPVSVSETLRKKVNSAVLQLGYVPNAGARSLMLRRSGTVGAVFPTVDNAIFAKAIDALQRRLAQSNMQLFIATSGYDLANETRQAISLVTSGADALALCGFSQAPELMRFLRKRKLPCVHVMVHDPGGEHVSVGFDNSGAMSRATRYLIDLGHRRIGMLAGICRHNDRAEQRVDGVRAALAAAGLALPPEYLLERPYSLNDARDGMRQLMSCRNRPTAVICGNDVLAFGALLEAETLGLRVPADVSILGFDDLELARHVKPALTTVRVETEEMWSKAADRLVAAIRGEEFPRSTELDVALVVRQSTGPAPALH